MIRGLSVSDLVGMFDICILDPGEMIQSLVQYISYHNIKDGQDWFIRSGHDHLKLLKDTNKIRIMIKTKN